MNRYIAILAFPLLSLAAVGTAGERLPEERVHDVAATDSRLPDNFEPMDDEEMARTRGVVNAPAQLSAPDASQDTLRHDGEMVQHQRADEAALVVDLDSRIQDTARALQGAPEAQRPQLEQRYQNLTTLRQGF